MKTLKEARGFAKDCLKWFFTDIEVFRRKRKGLGPRNSREDFPGFLMLLLLPVVLVIGIGWIITKGLHYVSRGVFVDFPYFLYWLWIRATDRDEN